MASIYQKTARDTIVVGIMTVLQFVIGLLQLPLLTKTLGAHDYGIWAQTGATVSLVLYFTSLGLAGAMVRFLAGESNQEEIREQFYSTISMLFMIQLVAALLVGVVLAPLIARNFFDSSIEVVRLAGALILLTSLSSTFMELIRSSRQLTKYCLFLIAEACIQFAVIAYLVLTDHGVFYVVLTSVAVKAMLLIALFFTVRSQIGIQRPRFSKIRNYLSYGLPLVPKGIAFWLVMLSDRYVISFFLGASAVGAYSAAYGVGNILFSFFAVLTLPMDATLSHLYDTGRIDEVKTYLRYVLKYILAIGIPFVFGAIVLGEPVLIFFTTPDIAEQGRYVLPVAALAILFLGTHNIFYLVLMLAKKTKIMAAIWISGAALNIGMNILLVPRIGIVGAAISTLIVFIMAMAVTAYYSIREFKFSIDWLFIIKSIIASAAMSVIVWLLHPQGHLYIIGTALLGVITYAILIFLMRGFAKEELTLFRGVLRQNTGANPDKDS